MRMPEAMSTTSYRTISVNSQPYLYLRIQLTVEGEDADKITPVQFKFLIVQALKENMGEVGAATPVDVLKLLGQGIALLRMPNRNAERLWAALTLYGRTPSDKRCAFRVLQVSPFLMGLAFDSREGR
ncbi:ribonuclease P protein subunit p14 [Aplysia californica]|uniref:Ribonuclease P protein subunit p14 n=1 Tax=Aplysia californica TaxID=6500 RepID=A0ABM0JZ68_APLCA|nr:ribonuclease P protein subunit p14 [Aplysia californica]